MVKENRQVVRYKRNNNIPKYPICGSTNIQKISIGTRAVKTAVFGVVGAVDDAGKTYKYENCGYTW